MAKVRLIHFDIAGAPKVIQRLTRARHQIEYEPEWRVSLLKQWRESPPDAFVIDLSRLPSHGREIAIELRRSAKTRHVPIVFLGGLPEKIGKVKAVLPDAAYCEPETLTSTLEASISRPVANPVCPAGMMDRYGERSLAQKLGIREGTTVAVMNAPADVERLLEPLPKGACLLEEGQLGAVMLVFIHSADHLQGVLSEVSGLAASCKLWAIWRKKNAKGHAGVTEGLIRDSALSLGLVDYKVCSINPIWSGLALAARK